MEVHKPMRAVSPGLFVLPSIAPSVPRSISTGHKTNQLLALAIKSSLKFKVPLPVGQFQDLGQVLTAQWTNYLVKVMGEQAPVASGVPTFTITDEYFCVTMRSEEGVRTLQLKPVIGRLEALQPGLGWFVWSVLDQANSLGLHMYETRFCGQFLEYRYQELEEFTDAAYAESLAEENGEPVELPLSDQKISDLIDQLGYVRPSTLLATVDGHAHLLHHKTIRPLKLGVIESEKWLSTAHGTDAQIVKSAIALNRELLTIKKTGQLQWTGIGYDEEPIGAAIILAWQCPKLLHEAIEHYEQNAMNSGCDRAVYACSFLEIEKAMTKDGMDSLIKSFKKFINNWALLSQLLVHFPEWDGDEK